MRVLTLFAFLTLALGSPGRQAAPAAEQMLKFPADAARDLGPIDKLVVEVTCGHVSSLRDVPALHNIEMHYETQTVNTLEARPRLGAAAVESSRWSGVIAVTAESPPCFSVKVEADGRTGQSRRWTGRELGLKVAIRRFPMTPVS